MNRLVLLLLSALLLVSCIVCLVPRHTYAAGEGLDLTTNGPTVPSIDIAGVRPMGMGNSGLALADGPEGFTLNPAGLSRYKGSFVEGGFYFHPAADNRVFNISIADAKTNAAIAGGASYSYYTAPRVSDGKLSTIEGHIVRLGTAFRWKDVIFAGVTLKWVQLNRPFYQPLSVPQADVGFTIQPHPLISFSVVGYNLIWNDSGETPISMGIGAAFGYKFPLRITVDWIIDFQTKNLLQKTLQENDNKPSEELLVGHEFRAGLELVIAKMFSIRAGYQYDEVRGGGHHLGVGLGFKYQRFGAEIAYRQQLAFERLGENRTFSLAARFLF